MDYTQDYPQAKKSKPEEYTLDQKVSEKWFGQVYNKMLEDEAIIYKDIKAAKDFFIAEPNIKFNVLVQLLTRYGRSTKMLPLLPNEGYFRTALKMKEYLPGIIDNSTRHSQKPKKFTEIFRIHPGITERSWPPITRPFVLTLIDFVLGDFVNIKNHLNTQKQSSIATLVENWTISIKVMLELEGKPLYTDLNENILFKDYLSEKYGIEVQNVMESIRLLIQKHNKEISLTDYPNEDNNSSKIKTTTKTKTSRINININETNIIDVIDQLDTFIDRIKDGELLYKV